MPAMFDRLPVRLERMSRSVSPSKSPRPGNSASRAGRRELRVGRQTFDCIGHLERVFGVDHEPCVAQYLWQSSAICYHHRYAKGHGFKHGNTESFLKRWLHEQPRAFIQLPSMSRIDVSKMLDSSGKRWALETLEPRSRLDSRVASQHQPRCLRSSAP
jgi:hypothetical protein